MAKKANLKRHEYLGLLLIFIGTTWLGFALYGTLLAANRLVVQLPLIGGNELFIFPLFYGMGALMFVLGQIELREAMPGKNR